MAYGKNNTAENVRRARTRVTRPEIEETVGQEKSGTEAGRTLLEGQDVGACDFKDQTMASILMEFVPDEVHREISMKPVEGQHLEDPADHDREKDGSESRKDRKQSTPQNGVIRPIAGPRSSEAIKVVKTQVQQGDLPEHGCPGWSG